jgi:hypothetical protein
MQAIPVIAGILLLGLVTLSGFQIVPEATFGGGTNTLNGGGVQIDTNVTDRAPASGLLSGSLTQVDPVITVVSIKSAQDIERNTATLRGRIVVGPAELGAAFFVYGYRQSDAVSLTQRSASYEQLLEDLPRGVQTKRVVSNASRTGDVSARVGGLAAAADYYAWLCVEVGAQLQCSAVDRFETLAVSNSFADVRIPTIRVADEQFISGEEITLELRVDMRDTNDGRVYIIYGESQSQVADAIEEDYKDIDENDERLQKERVAVNLIGSQDLVESIGDLDDETEYFYAACVSYEGQRDGFVCTRIDSFTTPNDDFGDSPRVTTTAIDVSGTTIALQGSVTMRSFRNGLVFFVYGTDKNTIQGVEGQRQMTSIRQNSDRLQLVLVDSDVDSSDSFKAVVDDLRFSTAYVARLCIEFENEDERGRDQLYVECGDTRGFSTN